MGMGRVALSCAAGKYLSVPAVALRGFTSRPKPTTMLRNDIQTQGFSAGGEIVAQLDLELCQSLTVDNRTVGSGVVGQQASATAAAAGYRGGMPSGESAMMRQQPLADLSPASFTPLGVMNFAARGLQV